MRTNGRILIVDDDARSRVELAELLRDEGYSVETAADAFKALPKLEEFAPDVLLTDLHMPGMTGLELMHKAKEQDPELVVIIMTAFAAVETAIAALKQGAGEYLTKPINLDELQVVLSRSLERRRLRAEAAHLRERLNQRHRIESIVGTSTQMQKVYDTILQVAPTRASVLITGESGTGKELIAAAIHHASPRSGGPFIKLHCAALAETLLESELFGHEKGSFTGAISRREGRFLQADRGTLFLDEIGEISPAIQVKLLRFLQEHEFERVGGNQTIKVDVRVIAATNKDLLKCIREGKFREDLYYRLNVVTIDVPPLRGRVSDIPLLAMFFLRRYAKENNKEITGFHDEALARLSHYQWPGNVRELENAIERAVIVARGGEIRSEDLSPLINEATAAVVQENTGPSSGPPAIPGSTMADIERYAIIKTLEHTGGSTSKAAEILGISIRKIQYRLHEYQTGHKPEGPDPA